MSLIENLNFNPDEDRVLYITEKLKPKNFESTSHIQLETNSLCLLSGSNFIEIKKGDEYSRILLASDLSNHEIVSASIDSINLRFESDLELVEANVSGSIVVVSFDNTSGFLDKLAFPSQGFNKEENDFVLLVNESAFHKIQDEINGNYTDEN